MSNSKRALVDIAILASIFFFPWWVGCIIAITACWFCDFYEIIFFGFLMDIFYDSGLFFHVGEHFISYAFTLMAFLILFILRKLKKRVRLNA
ncbi:MAG: hypothetical protein V4664_01485 [Patescibacteria group bacterium]